MRAILAGLFVFGGWLAAVAVLSWAHIFNWVPAPLVGLALAALMLLLVGAALLLFNKPLTIKHGPPLEDRIQELRQQGLIVEGRFQAKRAFEVEEFEDEGLHYFLELDDGRVLFMSGQYLYDFVEIKDDPEFNQPRRFPCTDFMVLRHKTQGYVLDLQCAGDVLDPEVTARPFGPAVFEAGAVPEDGDIITDASYEAIKAFHLRREA